jgi:hypothetical protein
MMRLRSCLPAVLLACATPPPPAPPPAAEAPPPVPKFDPKAEEVVMPSVERTVRNVEKKRPPPSRRSRQRMITEKEYQQYAKTYVLGFKPADCVSACKAEQAVTRADEWDWVLRCKLGRGLREEPVMQCREEAQEPAAAAANGGD